MVMLFAPATLLAECFVKKDSSCHVVSAEGISPLDCRLVGP